MDHSQVFSHARWRPITLALDLVVIVVVAALAARRVPDSGAKWRAVSATDLAVCLTLAVSLLYVGLSSFVVFGLGSSRSLGVCSLALWLCSVFYAGAKVTTSWFLIERARLVTAPLVPRSRDRLYLFNMALSLLWLAGFVIMVVFRLSTIRPADGECLITLGRGNVGVLIAVDVFLNVYYTSLFAVPLLRGKYQNPKLRQLAVKSALAAVLTVSSSVVNLGVFAGHHGSELSWVCLSTCTLDTAWCAVVLCALTGKRDDATAADATLDPEPAPHRHSAGRGDDLPGVRPGAKFGAMLGPCKHSREIEGAPVAGWGSFGRIEMGEADEGAGVGVESGFSAGGRGRRGSFAPDEMCLGAVNERKVVDGAWKAPTPAQGGTELGKVGSSETHKVEFAVAGTEDDV